nr:7-cyano-7-deazaguanine synthase [Tanacetum cinerariifolium]
MERPNEIPNGDRGGFGVWFAKSSSNSTQTICCKSRHGNTMEFNPNREVNSSFDNVAVNVHFLKINGTLRINHGLQHSFKASRKIPCRSGMCTSPIHVTSSQLVASDIFPVAAVKTLLYPGAVFNDLIYNMSIPSWNNILGMCNLTDIKGASAMPDLQRLE